MFLDRRRFRRPLGFLRRRVQLLLLLPPLRNLTIQHHPPLIRMPHFLTVLGVWPRVRICLMFTRRRLTQCMSRWNRSNSKPCLVWCMELLVNRCLLGTQ